jgi:hypothetical protein
VPFTAAREFGKSFGLDAGSCAAGTVICMNSFGPTFELGGAWGNLLDGADVLGELGLGAALARAWVIVLDNPIAIPINNTSGRKRRFNITMSSLCFIR